MPRPLKDFAVAGGGLLSLSHPISRSNDRFCGAVRTIEGTQKLRVTGRLTARSARSLARGAAGFTTVRRSYRYRAMRSHGRMATQGRGSSPILSTKSMHVPLSGRMIHTKQKE